MHPSDQSYSSIFQAREKRSSLERTVSLSFHYGVDVSIRIPLAKHATVVRHPAPIKEVMTKSFGLNEKSWITISTTI